MKFIDSFQIFKCGSELCKTVCPDLFGLDGFHHTFSLLRVVPKAWLRSELFFFFYFFNLAIVVKDTSSRH
jgi:hypothetical protein